MELRKINNMTYDLFLYNGEKDILNLRLHELNDCVDNFVILESDTTFQGNKKQRFFINQEDMFKNFLHKITYIPYTEKNINIDPWVNECNQRNALSLGLTNATPNDIVMISDVDEIPDSDEIKTIASTKSISHVYSFYHNFYYYNVNVRSKHKWVGTTLFNYGNGDFLKKGFNEIRRLSHHEKIFIPSNKIDDFNSGGWHFSNFGDADFMINKLESWSHTESNKPHFKNKETLTKCINEGIDQFNSPGLDLTHITETYLPKHINILPKELRGIK